MADFYIDENVPVRIAELLRHHGHNSVTTRDLRQEGAGDEEQLLTAAQRGWIFVTYNTKDFVLLHQAWCRWLKADDIPAEHAGILILPQAPRLSAEQAAQELIDLVDSGRSQGLSLAGQLYEWLPGQGWVRHE